MKIEGNEFRKGAGFIHSVTEDGPRIGQISNITIINVLFKAAS